MIKSIAIGLVDGAASTIDPTMNYDYLLDRLTTFENVDMVLTGELFLARDASVYKDEAFWIQLKTVLQEVCVLAQDMEIGICIGYPNRTDKGITIRQSLFFPEGNPFYYDKVHLGKNEEIVYIPGEVIDVTNYLDFTCGIQVCIDTHIPEMSIMQKLKGGEIILAPFNTSYGEEKRLSNWQKYLPARAYEYNICILCANTGGGVFAIDGHGQPIGKKDEINGAFQVTLQEKRHLDREFDYMAYRRPRLYQLVE